ncbi:MAG: hypothetical protein FJZ98_04205 [Chloroflexi bacterium]|nr:hypothetical protein [Chloroflexota bacterium]
MKIVILDGRTPDSNNRWSEYISNLTSSLTIGNHEVKNFILKDKNIHHCTGCFGCWVKTPGECVFDDDAREIDREIISADFVLWASPLVMGFPSYFLKKAMDRMIPLIHPYFEIVNGEAHHRARYKKYPLFGLLVQPGENDDERTILLVKQLFARTALNIKSRLCLAETIAIPVEELAKRIEKADEQIFTPEPFMAVKPFEHIDLPKELLVINGSPRAQRGNTFVMLRKIAEGFLSAGSNSVSWLHLQEARLMKDLLGHIEKADCILLGFPLYTDGMPGIVKEFIDSLEPLKTLKNNPPVGFLVHSGFPEAKHSRFVEQYLMNLAERLRAPYLGTIVKGGSEGIRMMPEKMNREFFEKLIGIGKDLAIVGQIDQSMVRLISGRESYPPIFIPVYKLLAKTPLMNFYWNMQLKKNGVYEKRFATPFQP